MKLRHRLAAVAATACLLGACRERAAEDRFATWRNAHRAEVDAYAAFLRDQGVANVVPLRDLLRSGRRWQRCGTGEFVIPPRTAWNAMPATLRLVHDLQTAGVIVDPRAASGFRDPDFNRCEGGSPNSRHLANNALDFDLGAAADERLCAWWRVHGHAVRFGLGFYSPTRIHIDSAGFRTWGSDHHAGSSLCGKPPR